MRRAGRLPLEALAPYLLDVPDPVALLNWSSIFANDNPVEVEVGFGKGLFLLTSSLANPQTNYLGIEIERKYQLFTANRIAKRNLGNVRLVKADARAFLRDCVPTESVQAVHVYFPDPWWKKRHHKRRLFTQEFAGQCARVLMPNGWLHVATDVEEYFRIMTELVEQQSLLQPISLPATALPAGDAEFQTNFERKSVLQGRSVNRAIYRKPV
ncbi:MAG: tRNA (guanosine(46)-N7)-methyltransferase TrmB [Gemmataceae bacterium]